MLPTLQLGEFTERVFITEEEWNDPEFQHLFDVCAKHVIAVNEIYSYEKELAENDNNMSKLANKNLMAMVILRDGLTVGEGIERMIELVIDIEKEFLQKQDIYLNKKQRSSSVIKFLDKVVIKLMTGNMKFSFESDRYQTMNVDNVFTNNFHI